MCPRACGPNHGRRVLTAGLPQAVSYKVVAIMQPATHYNTADERKRHRRPEIVGFGWARSTVKNDSLWQNDYQERIVAKPPTNRPHIGIQIVNKLT